LFNARFARRAANRYRRRGLDRTERRIAEFVRDRGVAGVTVLEIGGGVGEIGIDLVKAGAARARNLELSPAYEAEARRLAEEAGIQDRVDWRIHDIAEGPDTVEAADVVVLHRVVCCYPDYERLLGIAARHSRHVLVFSYPPRNSLSRAYFAAFNLVLRLVGSTFRGFVHPPAAMLATVEGQGLRLAYEHHGPIWQVAGHERPS
jgi:magnesium-protoporphyrin O-methyltransferase